MMLAANIADTIGSAAINLVGTVIGTVIATMLAVRITRNGGKFAPVDKAISVAKRYWQGLFGLLVIAFSAMVLWAFLNGAGPITRVHLITIPLTLFNLIAYSFALMLGVGQVWRRKRMERGTPGGGGSAVRE
ncbi:hypothetical protein [Pseudoxanthomonas yeongjuensis]|uniref:hypothetical protein n=1 Tax=Pseudoxanthomonas yeongjuensis TaxID=377616 RepID=UPI001390AC06|nr:hypothetical protein [Pseudoxanthomonas yeongjuensis]